MKRKINNVRNVLHTFLNKVEIKLLDDGRKAYYKYDVGVALKNGILYFVKWESVKQKDLKKDCRYLKDSTSGFYLEIIDVALVNDFIRLSEIKN